jgi:hypothetical protein
VRFTTYLPGQAARLLYLASRASALNEAGDRYYAISNCRGAAGPIVTTMRAFIIAVAALVALAPVANATPEDDQYLAALTARNIGGAPDKVIGYGHAACDNYGTPELVVTQMEGLEAIGYTDIQAKAIFGLGMQAYCPDKLPPSAIHGA